MVFLSLSINFIFCSHLVNFLTSVPPSCYMELLFPPNNPDLSLVKDDLHENQNVTRSLAFLVDFLEHQLDQVNHIY